MLKVKVTEVLTDDCDPHMLGRESDSGCTFEDVCHKPEVTHSSANKRLREEESTEEEEKCTKDCRSGFPNTCPRRGGPEDNLTCVQVHELLRKMGIENPQESSSCVKAGIQNGSIKVQGDTADLDQVLATGRADGSDDCRHRLKATLRCLLEQPDLGADGYGIDYDGATVMCTRKECEGTTYVTNMCSGEFVFENGKHHNHCTKCPGFGSCIDDFRQKHCSSCGDHYFAGRFGQFKCCKGKKKRKMEPEIPPSDSVSDSEDEELGSGSSFNLDTDGPESFSESESDIEL